MKYVLFVLLQIIVGCKNTKHLVHLSSVFEEKGRDKWVTLHADSMKYIFKMVDFDSLYLLSNHRKDSFSNSDVINHAWYKGNCYIKELIDNDKIYLETIKKSKDVEKVNFFLKSADVDWATYNAHRNYYDSFLLRTLFPRGGSKIIDNKLLTYLKHSNDSMLQAIKDPYFVKERVSYCSAKYFKEGLDKIKLSNSDIYVINGANVASQFYLIKPLKTKDGFLSYTKEILNPLSVNRRRRYN